GRRANQRPFPQPSSIPPRSSAERRVPALIPDDHGLLLLQPIQIARRLPIGRVDRVALVNRTHWDAIVILGGRVFGRRRRVRQRQLQGGHRSVIPGLWNSWFGIGPYLAVARYGHQYRDYAKNIQKMPAHTTPLPRMSLPYICFTSLSFSL